MASLVNLTGRRFGRWTVISRAGTVCKQARWNCLCDCGSTSVVYGGNLRNGASTSCGCYFSEALIARQTIHGKSGTPTFNSWASMWDRCTNENANQFKDYGGRGIKVCERWKSFVNFLADMGEKPDALTLDRYPNNNGNYEPGNCRWATRSQQNRNRRDNAISEIDAERIRDLHRHGYRNVDIGHYLNVRPLTVGRVARGMAWATE
jgi:hypothetical protein